MTRTAEINACTRRLLEIEAAWMIVSGHRNDTTQPKRTIEIYNRVEHSNCITFTVKWRGRTSTLYVSTDDKSRMPYIATRSGVSMWITGIEIIPPRGPAR